ncbi:MAG: ABC transporter permease [Anaerolineae bacterium]|nr:ABC transporter permease [Anaerolineae bacterium]
MAADEVVPIQLVDLPEEALSPREQRMARGAVVLRWGAIFNVVFSFIVIIGAVFGGAGVFPNLFTTLHNLLLGRTPGGDDAAVAGVILLTQLNISFLLVMMVGVLAREIWALLGVWLLAFVNIVAIALLGFTPGLLAIVPCLICGFMVTQDIRAFRINPVMLKELRGRMRGVRAFVVLTVYLGLMSGFLALLYLIQVPINQATGSAAAGEIGRVLFMGLVGIELMLIIFIAPAFTAGAITGERERLTYDLLRTTLLPSPSFVIGKLESALSYVLLLLLAAIPLQSIAFLFGGVSEQELVLSFIILTVTAIALGTIGIFFSALAPRTLSASVRAYTTALVATFGAPLVLSIAIDLVTVPIRTASPVVEAILIYIDDFLTSLNPIATALTTQQLLIDRQVVGFWTDTLSSNGSTIPRVSPWITFTIIYLVVSTVLVVFSIQRMRKTEA